jgi:TolA-binding protein
MRAQAGEGVMSAQRVWKAVGPNRNAEITRLRQELASFNEQIEALRLSALLLRRQIDEIRCSSAKDLTDLLASRAAIARDLSNHSRPGVRSQAAGYQEGDHD